MFGGDNYLGERLVWRFRFDYYLYRDGVKVGNKIIKENCVE